MTLTTIAAQHYTQKNLSSNQNHYDSPQGHQYDASIVMFEHFNNLLIEASLSGFDPTMESKFFDSSVELT